MNWNADAERSAGFTHYPSDFLLFTTFAEYNSNLHMLSQHYKIFYVTDFWEYS